MVECVKLDIRCDADYDAFALHDYESYTRYISAKYWDPSIVRSGVIALPSSVKHVVITELYHTYSFSPKKLETLRVEGNLARLFLSTSDIGELILYNASPNSRSNYDIGKSVRNTLYPSIKMTR